MSRPSHNLDRRLLDAGRSIILEEGISRMSLRAVARRARVNLGMFHYYFKNKQEFSRRCCSEAYAEFYKGFEGETSGEGNTVEKIRRGLLALARFIRDQRHFVVATLRDLDEENPEAWAFVKASVPPPHGRVIMKLIEEGQKEGSIIQVEPHTAMMVLMSSLTLASIMGALTERVAGKGIFKKAGKKPVHERFLSDEGIESRIDLVIRALLVHPPASLDRPRRKR
jgi:AcrR family transcriptional regulator